MNNSILRIVISILVIFSVFRLAFSAEQQFIIGFPEDNLSNDWRAAQVNEISRELKNHSNISFIISDADGSIAKNILDIEDMVDHGADLLFLGPKNPDAIAPVVESIRKKGVKIILLTRMINTDDYDVFISPDDFKIAFDAGIFIARHINGQGSILMLEGVPTTTTAVARKNGFMKSIKKYGGIKVISEVANYSRTEAINVIERLLRTGTKFDAIYAHNDAMAAGARFALKQAGINPASKPTVGIDFLPETRDAILKGEQLASFTYPTCGKEGVRVALELLQGKKVSRYIAVPSQLVTRKNVKVIATAY